MKVELILDYEKLAKLITGGLRESRWLSPAETSVYIGLPERTLEQYRREGRGPLFSRVGKHVRYNSHDIDIWMRRLQNGTA